MLQVVLCPGIMELCEVSVSLLKACQMGVPGRSCGGRERRPFSASPSKRWKSGAQAGHVF